MPSDELSEKLGNCSHEELLVLYKKLQEDYEASLSRIENLEIDNQYLSKLIDGRKGLSKRSKDIAEEVLENVPLGVGLINQAGIILYINSYFTEIFGYTASEIKTGEEWYRKAYPDPAYREKCVQLWTKDIENKVKFPEKESPVREYRIQCKDGTSKICEIFFGIKGDLVFTIFKDISKKKMNEQRIFQLSDKIINLVDSMPLGYIEIDKNYSISIWNQHAEKIFGYSNSEAMDRDIVKLLVPEVIRNEIYSILIAVTNQPGGTKSINENITKDGRTIICEWHIVPLKSEDGKIYAWGCLVLDVTQRIQFEEKLKEEKEKAEVANQVKSEFLANISHEIRTPLNAILGFSEILKEKLLGSEETLNYTNNIVKSGENLLNLLNDFLDLSKIESGRMELNLEPVSIRYLMNDLYNIYHNICREKGLDFILSIDESIPQTVILDQTRLRQVLFNLIGNAVKFTESGFIKVEVNGSINEDNLEKLNLKFSVSDSGVGIQKKHQKGLFESIKEFSMHTRHDNPGSGLGLSIAKKLVEMMNGTISLDSSLGQGSVFSFELKEVPYQGGVLISNSGHREIPSVNFKECILFLTEDIKVNRDVVKLMLKKYPAIHIYEMETGEDTLEKLKTVQPDLILMDIQLPGIDGYNTAKIIRANEKWKNIPILTLTAYAMKEHRDKYGAMFDEYLTKPINRFDLMEALIKYLPKE